MDAEDDCGRAIFFDKGNSLNSSFAISVLNNTAPPGGILHLFEIAFSHGARTSAYDWVPFGYPG